MRKKLDLYIIKKFLGTFFFILALLMAISVIFDISEKIDDFMESDAKLTEIVVNYYVNFIVYYSNLFSSLLVFISVILFTSRMALLTEIVAILSSGVSFNRMLRPFMISATIITAMSLMLNHFVVPYSNKTLNEFKYTYLSDRDDFKTNNIRREFEKGSIVYVESVAPAEHIAFKFSIERWKDRKLTYKLLSDRAIYDSLTGKWTIHNY
ncbi:MAG: LptF/LptG family permease, partial [Bacteroidota bacterium]